MLLLKLLNLFYINYKLFIFIVINLVSLERGDILKEPIEEYMIRIKLPHLIRTCSFSCISPSVKCGIY